MADKINGSVCLNHPNTPAVAHCAVCRKPVCKECVKVYDGVSYCSKECHESVLRTGGLVEDVMKKRNAVEAKRKIRNVLTILIIAALAFAGYKYYKANKAKIDSKARQMQYETQQKINKGKKDIENGLIKESKYKKQREQMVQ